MKKVIFQTLGCKVNQYETQGMREKLTGSGFSETMSPNEADLLVLNTCTVTGEGDKKSRYLIRRMHRLNPKVKIIVTGCYAEKNRDEILAIEGVTAVLAQNEKDNIRESAFKCFDIANQDFSLCRGQEIGGENPRTRFSDLSISNFERHTRAFVKVQDGCNHACSFCKVVLVRGRSRSRDFSSVIEEVKRLVQTGFHEIVLTGIQLGAYGEDLHSGLSLRDLASRLLEISGLDRLRLSSIEPTDVTDDLVQLMKQSSRFCPHLHIPLQSGDDEILERMRRRYDRQFYRELVLKLKNEVDHFALTCDVMCGFPGEREDQFQNTLDLLSELRPLKIHAFPYSRRSGTLASKYQDEVPASVIARRMKGLTRSSFVWQSQFLAQYLGLTVPVLVEEKLESKSLFRGRTSNYMLIEFEGDEIKAGDFTRVYLDQVFEDRIRGKQH